MFYKELYLKSGYISHIVTLDIMLLTLIQQTYSARTRQLKFTFTDILKEEINCWHFQIPSYLCLVTLTLLVASTKWDLDEVTKTLLLSQPTILIACREFKYLSEPSIEVGKLGEVPMNLFQWCLR